jgi:hypothetical protein
MILQSDFLLLSNQHNVDEEIDKAPSWNDGEVKQTIINFVRNITYPSKDNYIPSHNRVANFDNDGILW